MFWACGREGTCSVAGLVRVPWLDALMAWRNENKPGEAFGKDSAIGEHTPARLAKRQLHYVDLNSDCHGAAGCSCHAWCVSNTAALKRMPFHAHARFDWNPARAVGDYTHLFLHLNDIHGLRCLLSLALQVVVAAGSWQWLFPAKAGLEFSRQIHFNCLFFPPLLVKFIWTVKCQTLVTMRQFHWAAEWIKRLSYTRVGWQVPLKKAHTVNLKLLFSPTNQISCLTAKCLCQSSPRRKNCP